MKISVVISAYNEEKNIARVISSASFADEIVVIDNESTDKTAEIAKKLKCNVYSRPNNIMLNINKNYGFTKAKYDWILNLDADEEVTPELAKEIKEKINNPKFSGYWINRENIIFGKWIKHSLWWPDPHIRLFKKDKGKFPCIHIHEHLEIKGEIGVLQSSMRHYNYETISQFIKKMDQLYTENEAENFLKSGKKLQWQDAIILPARDFLKTFFAQKGYRDGLHGLVLSLLQAFYQLIVFAKVWEKSGFKVEEPNYLFLPFIKEVAKLKKEYRYWVNSVFVEHSKNIVGKSLNRLKRKLGL